MIPISRREDSNRIHFLSYASDGGLGFQCCSSGGSATGSYYVPNGSGLTTLNDGEWHQIAQVRKFGSGGFTQLYLDGVVVPGSYSAGSATDVPAELDAPLIIGRQLSASPGQFTGHVDDVEIYDRALTDSEIAAKYVAPATDLVARYDLNGNAQDASSAANHGTLVGTAVAVTGRTGVAATALSFAAGQYVTIPSSAALKGLGYEVTVVFWVKRGTTDLTGGMIPISRREDSNRIHFLAYASAGGFGFQCCSTGGSATGSYYVPTGSGLSALNDGAWHQIAQVRRFGIGGYTQLYVDGVALPGSYSAGSATDAPAAFDAPLILGRQLSASPGQFTGFLDDVRIYRVALTAPQIALIP